MNLTNRQQNWIYWICNFFSMVLLIGTIWYVHRYHEDDIRWSIGVDVCALLILICTITLPRILASRVNNERTHGMIAERVVLNGKECVWQFVGLIVVSLIVSDVVYYLMALAFDFPNPIQMTIYFAIGFTLFMSPIFADHIYRCCRNTYVLEGNNLIIDEWAWFRRKTEHLVIPISEIESVRKNAGPILAQPVEIVVAGIRRQLGSGIVGDELYRELKRRIAE